MNFYEKNLDISLYLTELTLIEESNSVNYNSIQLFEHKTLGKVFIIDGEIQHIETWVPLYHEIVVHLACAFVKEVRSVIILGGGDFFAAKEILKYTSVEKVIMIDHDQKIIDLILKHYDHAKAILDDPRFELQIDDAFNGIKKVDRKFDIIINDSVDLMNYSIVNNKNMFKIFSTLLKENGVCSDLIYRHIFEKESTKNTITLLNSYKLQSAFSLVTVPEYPGILHLLLVWGGNKQINQTLATPINLIQQNWITSHNIPCEYYNPNFLSYYLFLPPYLKRIANGRSYF